MKKPYVICHMMMSLDGRIDCGMTVQLAGNDVYYSTLGRLNAPSRISGRITAQTELATGSFRSSDHQPLGQEAFRVNSRAQAYNIVMDTRGTLQWADEANSAQPHLIITSEQVSPTYLEYLNQRHISWIATGAVQIDIARAMEILVTEFKVERVAIVGGGRINGGFVDAGLIDEISVVVGPGVDGRTGQPSLFEGRPATGRVLPLKLKEVQSYQNGTLWLRYQTK